MLTVLPFHRYLYFQIINIEKAICALGTISSVFLHVQGSPFRVVKLEPTGKQGATRGSLGRPYTLEKFSLHMVKQHVWGFKDEYSLAKHKEEIIPNNSALKSLESYHLTAFPRHRRQPEAHVPFREFHRAHQRP